MAIDVSRFHQMNVIDTCSIWNLLASATLRRATRTARLSFCLTKFVEYEALYKPRSNSSSVDEELKRRLVSEQKAGEFMSYSLDVEDLQEVELLENRRRLSKGELSSIAFAKKTQQAFLTDDQKARALAVAVLGRDRVQTVPHMFGWLFFSGTLVDHEKNLVVSEHQTFARPLSRYFEDMYLEACRCRYLASIAGS
jgi:hypothetical protein